MTLRTGLLLPRQSAGTARQVGWLGGAFLFPILDSIARDLYRGEA